MPFYRPATRCGWQSSLLRADPSRDGSRDVCKENSSWGELRDKPQKKKSCRLLSLAKILVLASDLFFFHPDRRSIWVGESIVVL